MDEGRSVAGSAGYAPLGAGDEVEVSTTGAGPAWKEDAPGASTGDGDDVQGHVMPSVPEAHGETSTMLSDALAGVDRDALIVTMIEVLSFYAEPDTYRAVTFRSSAPRGGFDSDRGGAGAGTFGRRAREVLALPPFAGLLKARATLSEGVRCPDCGAGRLHAGKASIPVERNGREVVAEVAAQVCDACGEAFSDVDAEAATNEAVIADLEARLADAEGRAALAPDPATYVPGGTEVEEASRTFDPDGWAAPADWEGAELRRTEVRDRMARSLVAAATARVSGLRGATAGGALDAPPASGNSRESVATEGESSGPSVPRDGPGTPAAQG